MFTGIVEEMGSLRDIQAQDGSAVLSINAQQVLQDARDGDSIAVNGVCLTVTAFDADSFQVDVMDQTLRLTSLGALLPGSAVNLERAMSAGGRFGGHLVQGHVDAAVRVLSRQTHPQWERVEFELPDTLARYLVAQGSVTVDGVSLTVAELGPQSFTVSLIPTTLNATTLGRKAIGDLVNVEVDVLAKYVERLTTAANERTGA